jgi:hypothetical protein
VLQQRAALLGAGLEIPVDVLHHDHGGIDDDAEVDRAERQEVCVLAAQHQNDDGKEQREGNVDADDDRASEIAEEYPLNEEDQKAAEDQVVQHGVRGHTDQRAAVVVGNDLNARRQAAVLVEFLDFGLHLREDVVSVLGAPHHHDGGGNIIVAVSPRDAEARHMADRNGRDILDLDRQAVGLRQNDVLNVLNPVALSHILGAARVDEPDAADIDRLLPDRDLATADIDVAIPKRADQLRHGDVVGLELFQVRIDIELLGGATPGIDLRHSGNGEQAARDNIVLQGAQIGQPEVRRPDDLVAEDLAD